MLKTFFSVAGQQKPGENAVSDEIHVACSDEYEEIDDHVDIQTQKISHQEESTSQNVKKKGTYEDLSVPLERFYTPIENCETHLQQIAQ